jgi:hypothetical protein
VADAGDDRDGKRSNMSTTVQALSVPIPTSAAEVPGPASGNVMTEAYVQTVRGMAYIWGWLLLTRSSTSGRSWRSTS